MSLEDQATGTMTPTQAHYPDTVLISPCLILLMPSIRQDTDKYRFCNSLAWVDRESNSRPCTWEACALVIGSVWYLQCGVYIMCGICIICGMHYVWVCIMRGISCIMCGVHSLVSRLCTVCYAGCVVCIMCGVCIMSGVVWTAWCVDCVQCDVCCHVWCV